MRKLLFICLLIFSGLSVQAQQPTAPNILKTVAAVYSGCRTYSDEGTASFKFAGFGPFGRREAHFHTAFVSPDRFRFDIDTGGKTEPWVVWKDGDLIRLSNRSGFFERSPSLDSALLQMAFTSFGSSLTVPELLFTKSLMRAVVSGVRSSNNCSTRSPVNAPLVASTPLTLISRLRFELGANTAVTLLLLTVAAKCSGCPSGSEAVIGI